MKNKFFQDVRYYFREETQSSCDITRLFDNLVVINRKMMH